MVRLLPELVGLTEVVAELVLVLNHVPGDAEVHQPSSGRAQPVFAAGVVIAAGWTRGGQMLSSVLPVLGAGLLIFTVGEHILNGFLVILQFVFFHLVKF